MKTVAEIFGIETTTEELYKKALTHSSYTKEKELPHMYYLNFIQTLQKENFQKLEGL